MSCKSKYSEELVQILKERGIGNPSKAINTDETFRGFLTSISNGSFLTIITYILLNVMNYSVNSVALITSIIGTFTSYSLDILFAKKSFNLKEYKGKKYKETDDDVEVDYKDIMVRLIWLLKSFTGSYFTKFLIVSVIDSAIYLVILDFIRRKMDKNNIKFKFRNLLLILILPSITFFLYVNQLRFRWAYDSNDKPIMNILMFIWLTILLILNFIYFGTIDNKNFEEIKIIHSESK